MERAVHSHAKVPFPTDARAGLSDEASSSALWLQRLTLSDFRCYARATIEADRRPLVLTGPNGAGKTNLLEAVSFLAPGRGLRRARLADVDRAEIDRAEIDRAETGRGQAGKTEDSRPRAWAVAARMMTAEGPRDLGTGRDPATQSNGEGTGQATGQAASQTAGQATGRERRLVKIDGSFARGQQTLGEVVSMVWLTPQMDGLFRDGASGRRRFLDRLVYGFDTAHASRVNAYEQVLRERARLLKARVDDDAWLASLEGAIAEHGVAVAAARRALLSRLAGACAAGVGPFPRAGLGLVGEVEAWLDELSALEAEERLRGRLVASRHQDAQSGGAAIGPHRSDLAVRHLETGLGAELCSTGEQKALLLSIILAFARLLALDRGAAPLLLLDEVAAHLDEQRRVALFEELLALDAQAWLTGTDRAFFAALGDSAQFFQVKDATISRTV